MSSLLLGKNYYFDRSKWIEQYPDWAVISILLLWSSSLCVPGITKTTNDQFYVYGSVHRWSKLITVQRDATQSSLFIILQVHSTCFGYQPHPSSGVHKTVTTDKLSWPRWREVAAQKIWPVPEAVVTVLCTPDDGCGWHPKHVEWTCRIIDCFVLHLVGQLLI